MSGTSTYHFNIANPATGLMKKIDVDDAKLLVPFFGQKIGSKVDGSYLGDEFKGYVFRISGGNDKEGFPMLNGVMTEKRVKILLSKGMKCFKPRREGARARRTVRGCIVGDAIRLLNLTVFKKGENEIPGLTDGTKPNRLGPKRAGRMRKTYGLSKDTELKGWVVAREIKKEGKKDKVKRPKIQRLVTDRRVMRKSRLRSIRNKRFAESAARKEEYKKNMEKFRREMEAEKAAKAAKKKKTETK